MLSSMAFRIYYQKHLAAIAGNPGLQKMLDYTEEAPVVETPFPVGNRHFEAQGPFTREQLASYNDWEYKDSSTLSPSSTNIGLGVRLFLVTGRALMHLCDLGPLFTPSCTLSYYSPVNNEDRQLFVGVEAHPEADEVIILSAETINNPTYIRNSHEGTLRRDAKSLRDIQFEVECHGTFRIFPGRSPFMLMFYDMDGPFA